MLFRSLGITSMELLQPENLTALFANATGIENNPQELVLNSDFTGLYADVMDIASQNQALLEAVSNMEVLEKPQVLEIFTEPDNPGEIITASAEEDIAKVQISDVTDETEEPVFQQPQVKSEAIGTSDSISASEDNTVSGSQGMLETAEVEASNISETAVSSESIDSSETVSLKSEKQVMKTDLNSDSSSDERSFDDKSENKIGRAHV